MSVFSLILIILLTFLLFILIGILGRIRVKTRYLAIIAGVAIFIILSIAFYINDNKISVFSLILSLIISLFCMLGTYFSFEAMRRLKR
jgi:hypothetical protein